MLSSKRFVQSVKCKPVIASQLQISQLDRTQLPRKVGFIGHLIKISWKFALITDNFLWNWSTGVLLCMPGFIGNYRLTSINETKLFNSLGCKLVTAFPSNSQLIPPKPNILANIFLMNDVTGEIKAIVQGTEITAWRTAAASIVATKFLYSSRPSLPKIDGLAILGCGVQVGEITMNSNISAYPSLANFIVIFVIMLGSNSCYRFLCNKSNQRHSIMEPNKRTCWNISHWIESATVDFQKSQFKHCLLTFGGRVRWKCGRHYNIYICSNAVSIRLNGQRKCAYQW